MKEPPYDGNWCPMCPQDERDLHAQAHNLVWRMKSHSYDSLCAIGGRIARLRECADKLPLANPCGVEDLHRLRDGCRRMGACKTYAEAFALVGELDEAVTATQPLLDAHFANREHAYGASH